MDLKERTDILDFIHGFAKSQMFFAAVDLGIFEYLEMSGVQSANELADLTESDRENTERLLNACASIGFLTKDKNGLFSNTSKAKWCLKTTKGSLYGDILVNKNSCYYTFGHLSEAVKSGTNVAPDVFGVPGDKLYSFGGGYYKDKSSTEHFVQAMDGCSFGLTEESLRCFALQNFKIVCDLGGGSGIFSTNLAKMYPQMDVILFDLPAVISVTEKAENIPKNVRFMSGDFFEDILPSADLYMLNHVLEDWSEENGKKLIKKIYTSLPKGGALFICGYCLPSNKVAETFAHVVDLNQLASCEGKMRNAEEWTDFIKKAAEFSEVKHKSGISYFGDIIMAKK